MGAIIRALSGTMLLALAAVSTANAGPFEDGLAAANNGDYATALRLWRPLAEQGDAGAQYSLGVAYSKGQGLPRNDAAAAMWWRKAAEQGDAAAQYNLGFCYENGDGVPQDYREAIRWYQKAAFRPYVVPVSAVTAASNLGAMEAAVSLGIMYQSGRGVQQNYVTAMNLFLRPANQGFANAMYSLGVLYNNGEGVPQDYVLAHMWFNLAAARFTADEKERRDNAARNREHLAAKMTTTQIAEAQRLAREWKPKPER